ncbi:hypothetical protein [Sphingobacterium sp. UGAL515B_05]|uniref:hypothetical protein n=1 Tax=Sphingobacterium sp. UGAL515B_05 TaxID=2986767 RepID=UPI002953D680|nr:hypothetical protein [Sphingobacterium sp. UGAL515B_05]WON96079.1 hypothetical protein OK025_06625 [Sphingobacterium sp. UGAL515B_05]
MKKINNNLANKFALAAFLALGTLAVTTSCSKNNNPTEEIAPDGKNQVIVRIAGLNENTENISTKASNTNSTKASENLLKLVEGDEFDAIVGVTNSSSASSGLKASSGSRAATTALAATTTYSLYFYKKNPDNSYSFVKSVPLTAGAVGTIDLQNGSYKWLAVSYNNTDVLPIGATATTVPTTTTLDLTKDVLIASSTSDLVINSNSVPLNITFNRVFSTVTVEVNTLGMFAPMTANPTIAVSCPNGIKTKTIDFSTGNLSLSNVSNLNLTQADFTDVSPVGTDAYQKVATFKTAEQSELTVNAQISQLKIKVDDGSTRNFGASLSNQNIKITPLGGKNQRLLVGLAESALNYGTVGGSTVQWGRSNLYYRTGGALNATPYRFYHTNPNQPDANESFFSFKGHLPRTFASTVAANQKDPCALVYPAGLWKTPTSNEVGVLTSNSGVVDGLLGDIIGLLLKPGTPGATAGSNYMDYTGGTGVQGSVYPTATNRLRFYNNGVATPISIVSGLVSLNFGSGGVGQTAAFWSSDQLLTGDPLLSLLQAASGAASVGATSYIGATRTSLVLGDKAVGTKSAGLLNINALGLGVIASDFMNVRCTRNASWNGSAPGYNPMPAL